MNLMKQRLNSENLENGGKTNRIEKKNEEMIKKQPQVLREEWTPPRAEKNKTNLTISFRLLEWTTHKIRTKK